MTATLAAGGLLTKTERAFDPRATCDHCGVAPAAVKWVFRSRNLSGTHHCLPLPVPAPLRHVSQSTQHHRHVCFASDLGVTDRRVCQTTSVGFSELAWMI